MAKPVFSMLAANSAVGDVRVVKIEIPGKITTPGEAAEAVEEVSSQLTGNFGIVFDGGMPMWMAGMLVHAAHATQWVATNDPRLGGAVVVASHSPAAQMGQIVPFTLQ